MQSATVTDVTARDGLQDAGVFVPLAEKVALIEGLAAAGLPYIEATSFTHPSRIPMLRDADELIPMVLDVVDRLVVLTPNRKGVERAVRAGAQRVLLVASASEGHSRANLNHSREEAMRIAKDAAAFAGEQGMATRGGISVAFECPFDGIVPTGNVVEAAEMYLAAGVEVINLADTLGTATPQLVKERIRAVRGAIGAAVPLGLHLHDRNGCGLANVAAAIEEGVTHFESALGSLGGCPYAPGAAGNLDTETLLRFLEVQGIATGVDLDLLPRLRESVLSATSPTRKEAPWPDLQR